MANETVTAIISAIAGNDETRELIARTAISQSVMNKLTPIRRLTSPVVRGAWAGEAEAQAVEETGTRPMVSGLLNAVSYQVKPLSVVIPISNTLYESEDDLVEGITKQLAAAIARGVDREVLRNPGSVFTQGVVAAATEVSNVVTIASGSAFDYVEVSNMFALVEADGFNATGVVVRDAAKGALRMVETSNGQRYFVPATAAEPATIFGAPAHFVKSAGTLPVLPATAAGSETVMVAGDWTQLHLGYYGDVKLSVNPYSHDYWITGRTLVLAELLMGYAILNKAAFAVLKEAA